MESPKVVLFDGVCNLCNSSVQFLIRNDKSNKLKFASLQSDFGQNVLLDYHKDSNDFDSFIYLRDNRLLEKSTAALYVIKDLGGIYSVLFVFIFVPAFIRNALYSYVAKNRYRWFGKREQCMMPTTNLQDKFIS